MSRGEQTGQADVRAAAVGLLRGVLRQTQAASLAAALIPLAAVPITLTDGLAGGPTAAQAQTGACSAGACLWQVSIPTAAQCGISGGTSGTAVAMIPGGKLGFPQYPSLLVTSCRQADQFRLFFINPQDGTLVGTPAQKPLLSSFAAGPALTNKPGTAWESLAHRPDKGDLLACGTVFDIDLGDRTVIYAIDYSPLTSTPDGTATFLRNGAGSSCAGIAWDVEDVGAQAGRIYQADGGEGVSFFGEGPSDPATFLQTCPSSGQTGITVAGSDLFAACSTGSLSIREIHKTTGALVASFSPDPTPDMADIECDPVTFALPQSWHGVHNRDVVWVKDEFSPSIYAREVSFGACGAVNSPALHPACLVNGVPADGDGDGLLDCWEDGAMWADTRPGIAVSRASYFTPDVNGNLTIARPLPIPVQFRDLILCDNDNAASPGVCATKTKKDLFVEVDTMTGHSFAVGSIEAALASPPVDPKIQVKNAFANAPVDGTTGIELHIQHDEQNLPHTLNTAFFPCTPPASANANSVDFDFLKLQSPSGTLGLGFFGTVAQRNIVDPVQRQNKLAAKKLAFRYGMFVHNLVRLPATSSSPSGCGELPGNDFVVALGSFGATVPGDKQATADQQAGTFMHELGHTLYLRHGGLDNVNCKANYQSAMSYTRQFSGSPIAGRRLDFSRFKAPTLNETTGYSEVAGIGTPNAEYVPGDKTAAGSSTATTARILSTDSTSLDWNRDGDATDPLLKINLNRMPSTNSGCDGTGTIQEGYDDWANLQYNFRAAVDYLDGVHSAVEEVMEDLNNPPDGVVLRPSCGFDGSSPTPGCGGIELTEEQATNLFLLADLEGNGICGTAPCRMDGKLLDGSNTINLAREPLVVVALFGSSDFNVQQVDPASLTLKVCTPGDVPVCSNDQPVVKIKGHPACIQVKVNGDAFRELVCTFPTTGFPLGVNRAIVEGHLRGTDGSLGTIIAVQDTVRVVRRHH